MPSGRRVQSQVTLRESAGSGAKTDGDAVLLVAGPGLLSTFRLRGADLVIGRAPECDVVIEHRSLSRRHARLRLGSPLTVQDLGSTNGTRVARRTLHGGEPAPLGFGESFHIGKLSLVVLRGAAVAGHDEGVAALEVLDPTEPNVSPLVSDVAASGVSVLVLGETGVGKEVLAETLHALSKRKGALVRVNCAALSPLLLESELFGHEKGAFTGAAEARPGLLEAADGGTVLLDEVGELPEAVQVKLLRVLETREVLRVGAVRPRKIDVRLVAATNRDLPGEVARGRFRRDLFFRLDGITLTIPPLRARPHQISRLALQFLREAQEREGSGKPLAIAPELLATLEAHDWPGNVRELKAVLERAALLARGGQISSRHLALSKSAAEPPAHAERLTSGDADERQRILDALDQCGGNQTRAAKLLGISRTTLVTKLGFYRITRPRK